MQKILSKTINRLSITIVLILIQALWLLSVFLKLTKFMPWLTVILALLSIIMYLFIILKNDNPAYKILWITLISLTPIVGGLMYLCFGNKRPAKKMREKLNYYNNNYLPYINQKNNIETDKRVYLTSKYINAYSGYPLYKNTQTEYFSSGEAAYKIILRELKKAKSYIFIEFFIIAEGQMWSNILDILKEKAKNGVDVRVVYDDMGSLGRIPKDYFAELEQMGIKAIAFNKVVPFISVVMNHRDHRKMIIIDGHTAFSGGINIGDEYINVVKRYGHWKDTGFMLKGEAVYSYTIMFLIMWNSFYNQKDNPMDYEKHITKSDGYVQPFTDSPLDNEPLSENIYMDILWSAEDYVYIFTPYIAITNEMQTAIINAAKRGVDIRIVTPGISDNKIVHRLTRSYYKTLIKNGVKIYEYKKGFIHAKSFVSDDKIAVTGTINMDYRSLYLHFECGCLFYKSSLVNKLKSDSINTIKESSEIKITDCKNSFINALFDAVLRLISPLM